MKITNVSIKKIIHYFIYIYIIFLPIDAALPKIMYIGSPLNLISIIIILLTILYVVLFQNGIITNNNKLKILIIMYLYFIYSSFIGLQLGVNTFSLFGFSLHALLTITILSSNIIDLNNELMIKLARLSFVVLAFMIIPTLSFYQSGRFFLNLGHSMDPNYFASNLILYTFFFSYDLFILERKRFLNSVSLILVFLLILFTGSRGGLLANIPIIFFMIYLSVKSHKKIVVKLTIFFIALIGFLIIKDYVPITTLERFNIMYVIETGGTGRTEIWKEGFNEFVTWNPLNLLFGKGLGTFRYIHPRGRVAHNNFLKLLFETGFIGLTIFIILLIMGFKTKNPSMRQGLLIAIIFMSLGLDTVETRIFWLVILLVYSKTDLKIQ